MNGNKFLLDTNIIIYILEGDKIISEYLSQTFFFTSIICEIELLSLDIPLVTSDKGFKQITELSIDFYNKLL